MAKKRKPPLRVGPLTRAQLDIYLAIDRGVPVSEIAQSRRVSPGTVENQAYIVASKLTVPRTELRGSLRLLSEKQRALLQPVSRPACLGLGADGGEWPPETCPCCGQAWPGQTTVGADGVETTVRADGSKVILDKERGALTFVPAPQTRLVAPDPDSIFE